jgi:hypothetical protein
MREKKSQKPNSKQNREFGVACASAAQRRAISVVRSLRERLRHEE